MHNELQQEWDCEAASENGKRDKMMLYVLVLVFSSRYLKQRPIWEISRTVESRQKDTKQHLQSISFGKLVIYIFGKVSSLTDSNH